MLVTLAVKQRLRVRALAYPNPAIGRFSGPQAEERAILTVEGRIRAGAAEEEGVGFGARNGLSPFANVVGEAREAGPAARRFIRAFAGDVVGSDGDAIGEVAYRVGKGVEGEEV